MGETPQVAATPAAPAVAVAAKVNFPYHAIIGVAMGAVGVFTGLAWIPAILTGMVIGHATVEQRRGVRASFATQLVRVLAVTGGVLAMLLVGVIIGGLIAFLVAALASFSERLVGDLAPNDQTIARIFTVLVAVGTWFVVITLFRVNFNVSIGS